MGASDPGGTVPGGNPQACDKPVAVGARPRGGDHVRFRIALTVDIGRNRQVDVEEHELEAETRVAGFQPNETEDEHDDDA